MIFRAVKAGFALLILVDACNDPISSSCDVEFSHGRGID